MPNPKVSVVIPCYNGQRFIKESIESVISQTYRELEIIVVDDGSTDQTAKIVVSIGDSRIKCLYTENKGVSSARNYGIKNSSGEFIALLDYDDLWLPGKIEEQVREIERSPDIALVYSLFYVIDSLGKTIVQSSMVNSKDILEDLLVIGNVIGPPSGTLIRNKIFNDIGGFDPKISTAADWDLWIRIAFGYRVVLLPEYLFKYRVHGNNMHRNIAVQEDDIAKILNKFFVFLPKTDRRSSLKSLSFSNAHLMLAKSYLKKWQLTAFLRNIVMSFLYHPLNFFVALTKKKMPYDVHYSG